MKLIFEGKNLGSTKDRAVAWGVHLLTASGVLLAMAAVVSIFHHKPGHALLWLVLAQVVDGLDGPLARKFNVKKHAPVVDGNVLDLVVDYLTCVIVPMAFAARFGIFPAQVEMWIIAAILYVSVIWFARKDIETKDMWFRGFPTAWNLVVTAFWMLGTSQSFNLMASSVLVVLTLTPKVKFFHALSSRQFRNITVPFTTFAMLVMAWMAQFHQRHNAFGQVVVVAWVVYAGLMTIWRSLQPDELE